MKKSEIIKNRVSIAVVSVYDPDGIIDDYLIFYITSLKYVVDRLIIAVNGELTAENMEKVRKLTDEIYFRPNIGFDFGAYKEVIENYLTSKDIMNCRQLILCNDTCFGPFVPFSKIFIEMQKNDPEFWSINYIDDPLLPHFQSYFMVARKRGIKVVTDFLQKEVKSKTTDMIVAHGYEHGLSEVILLSNIKTDYYTSRINDNHDIDIFAAPDYAMEKLKFPMLKRKAFSKEYIKGKNCREALRMIAEKGEYPVNYILENIHRIYSVTLTETDDNSFAEPTIFEKNYASRQDVIQFCRKHKKVYIYGNGYMSVLFLARFHRYMEEFGGYVVSEEYYKSNRYKGKPVYSILHVKRNTPLIIALRKELSERITDNVKDMENVLFLSINMEKSER